jgi:hypothetical protein
LAIFLTATAFLNHEVFTSLWFPHLYYFPFAVFTLSLARLVDGRADSLGSLAVSAGFLINGHVAFAALTPMMLAGASLANGMLARSPLVARPRTLWSTTAVRAHARPLSRAVAILSLFLAPLLLETVVNFPGPVPKYLGYGQATHGHGVGDALRFVGQYWAADVPALMWAVLCLSLVACLVANEKHGVRTLPMLAVLVVASSAVVVYALIGIDDLGYRYVASFYYAVPALGMASAALRLFTELPSPSLRLTATLASLGCLGLAYSQITKPPQYQGNYGEPQIPELFHKMRGLGRLPLVLDLNDDNDWPYVWAHVLGVQAHARRAGVRLFCINRKWAISFTDAARCSDAELQRGQRLIVARSSASRSKTSAPDLDYLGLAFYRFEPPVLAGTSSFTVASDAFLFSSYLLGDGWSAVEGDFVWSVGPRAELILGTAGAHRAASVVLDLGAFLPSEGAVQAVDVQIGGQSVGMARFTREANRGQRTFAVPPDARNPVAVTLLISNPTSPMEAGISRDSRKLGVSLYGITIESSSDSPGEVKPDVR